MGTFAKCSHTMFANLTLPKVWSGVGSHLLFTPKTTIMMFWTKAVPTALSQVEWAHIVTCLIKAHFSQGSERGGGREGGRALEVPATLLITTCTLCTEKLNVKQVLFNISPAHWYRVHLPHGRLNASIITVIIFGPHLAASFEPSLTRGIYHGGGATRRSRWPPRTDLFLTRLLGSIPLFRSGTPTFLIMKT